VAIATKKKRDPKVGTGKKPKGSGRRLYTDENPKDTVSIKFATPADARATVAKVKKINKPYARKIQILTVGEQRAKVMGKTEKRKRCKTCECYDCDCEECSCDCHHNDRVLTNIHDRQTDSQSDTEI
jgi:hypothetical protein